MVRTKFKKNYSSSRWRFQEKCWGEKNFTELTKNLNRKNKYKIIIIGTKDDEKKN